MISEFGEVCIVLIGRQLFEICKLVEFFPLVLNSPCGPFTTNKPRDLQNLVQDLDQLFYGPEYLLLGSVLGERF